MASGGSITLSVIVPVHQASSILADTLDALASSDFPRERWELIVVDDASTDDSSLIGARYADTIVRLPGRPKGPAYARNRGFEVARGEIVVFIDSDVRVHPDTLSGFAECFEREPEVAAVFGSYDDDPPAPGIVSQYRNLLHHYVHQQSAGDAETFWAGCGQYGVMCSRRPECSTNGTSRLPRSRTSSLGVESGRAGIGSCCGPRFRARTSSTGP